MGRYDYLYADLKVVYDLLLQHNGLSLYRISQMTGMGRTRVQLALEALSNTNNVISRVTSANSRLGQLSPSTPLYYVPAYAPRRLLNERNTPPTPNPPPDHLNNAQAHGTTEN